MWYWLDLLLIRRKGALAQLARDVATRLETVEPGGFVPLDEVAEQLRTNDQRQILRR